MKKLLEIIDAKLVTSVGGIILAAGLSFILYKILTNDLTHIGSYIQRNTEVLTEVKGVVQTNTAQALRLENAIDKLGNRIR